MSIPYLNYDDSNMSLLHLESPKYFLRHLSATEYYRLRDRVNHSKSIHPISTSKSIVVSISVSLDMTKVAANFQDCKRSNLFRKINAQTTPYFDHLARKKLEATIPITFRLAIITKPIATAKHRK